MIVSSESNKSEGECCQVYSDVGPGDSGVTMSTDSQSAEKGKSKEEREKRYQTSNREQLRQL